MNDRFIQSSNSEWMAYFVVTNDSISGPELQARIGLKGDEIETVGEEFKITPVGPVRRRDTSSWTIQSVAIAGEPDRVHASMPMELHLEWLLDQVLAIEDRLRSLREDGSNFHIQIVQYMSNEEFQGHGISIGREWVRLLSVLDGRIDIDQYVRSEIAHSNEIHGD